MLTRSERNGLGMILVAALLAVTTCLALPAGAQNTVTTTPAANPANSVASGAVTGTLSPANGGTGVANNAAATTTRSGNHALTITLTAPTSVTFPITGTLATTATFAAPPAIGNTTPAAVTGTTVTATTQYNVVTTSNVIDRVATAGVRLTSSDVSGANPTLELKNTATTFTGIRLTATDRTVVIGTGGSSEFLVAGGVVVQATNSYFKLQNVNATIVYGYIVGEAANHLRRSNGANAQTDWFCRTYTDVSNHECASIQSGAGYFELAAVTAGTGTDNIDLRITPAGTGKVVIGGTASPGAADACTAGGLTWDTGFVYVCTATGVWKRAALTGGY